MWIAIWIAIALSAGAMLVACLRTPRREIVREPKKKYRLATFSSGYTEIQTDEDIRDRNAYYLDSPSSGPVAVTPFETLPTFMRRLLKAANVDITVEPGQPATPSRIVIRNKEQENEKATFARHPLDPRGVSGDISGS